MYVRTEHTEHEVQAGWEGKAGVSSVSYRCSMCQIDTWIRSLPDVESSPSAMPMYLLCTKYCLYIHTRTEPVASHQSVLGP